MTNADILMGVVVLFACVFLVWPCVLDMFGADMRYKDAVLSGVFLTLLIVVLIAIVLTIFTAIAYFSNALNPESPAQDFINWVNTL